MSKKTKSQKIIAGAMSTLSLIGGGIAPMLIPMSAYASTTFKEGTKTYTLPELTDIQKQQVQSGIQTINQAIVNHQINLYLPLQHADSFSIAQRNAIIAYMVRAALKANRQEFRNGQYLSGILCPGMRSGANSTTLVITFFYNISQQQDDKAWQHAQDLVKQLKISNDQNTGMRQIYDYLRKNFAYDSNLKAHHKDNNGQNALPRATAYGAWYVPVNGQHKTNCTGYAQMFYLLCRAKGWNNVYVVRNGVHTHAYNAVVTPNGVKYVDANYGYFRGNASYFMVTQSKLNSMDNWHKNTDF